ncbi:MAG: methionyl-tRNA formyltransferase [Deltaproteobacteria bacterium]|nr:methionyl-tRNA formyltransferase [Deltaproteobacteria bacterium]
MNESLRIIFMGTPDFAVPTLQALIDSPDQVVTVICQPDRKKGRGRKLSPPPIKVLAEQNGIPVLQPTAIRTEEFLEKIQALQPDLIVVTAYGRILPGSLLNLPPLGTINVHGSLLPKYRGAAPIQWAVLNGETETGVTIMQMDEGMDTGDILLPVSLPIEEDDTSGTLFVKLSQLGGQALVKAIGLLKEGKLPPVKQVDSLATEAPMLDKKMGHLNWSQDAAKLHSVIRGLDPWPSAYGFLADKRFRFFKPQVVGGEVVEKTGTLCRADKDGILVATSSDYLLIREIQPEGKKRMSVQSCLCGMKLPVGERFS